MEEEGLSERDWRIIWQEVLDEPARQRIKRAIWRGQTLDDPDEAAVALERATRMRRAVKWSASANVLLGLLLIAVSFYVVDLPSAGTFWWLVGVYVVVVVLSPIAGWVRRWQLDRAIAANSYGRNR